MTDPTVLDHIGIAVESIDDRIGFYKALGLEVEGYDEVPEQGVRIAFLPVGDCRLELLEPTGPNTPIARHLERRGPGLHHVCLRVPDIRAAMVRLAARKTFGLLQEPVYSSLTTPRLSDPGVTAAKPN